MFLLYDSKKRITGNILDKTGPFIQINLILDFILKSDGLVRRCSFFYLYFGEMIYGPGGSFAEHDTINAKRRF